MKKHKGSVLDFLPSLLVFFAFFIIVLVVINVMKLVSFRQDVKAVVREYILEMETVGYLTPEREDLLVQRLASMGAESIDLLDTTVAPVRYGYPIDLQLSCTVSAETLDMSVGDLLEFIFEDAVYEIEFNMRSTAKY